MVSPPVMGLGPTSEKAVYQDGVGDRLFIWLFSRKMAKAVGKARSTVAEWMRVVRVDGLSALLALHQGRGRAPQLKAKAQKELRTGLRRGRWRRLKDARAVARPAASGGDGLGRSLLLGKKSGGGLARATQNPRPTKSGTG